MSTRELKPELMLALGEATALLHDDHPKLANAIVEAVNLLIEWRSADDGCRHRWITRRSGGSLVEAGSDERVTYCDICGEEPRE